MNDAFVNMGYCFVYSPKISTCLAHESSFYASLNECCLSSFMSSIHLASTSSAVPGALVLF